MGGLDVTHNDLKLQQPKEVNVQIHTNVMTGLPHPYWPIRQMDGMLEEMYSVVRCIKGVIMMGSLELAGQRQTASLITLGPR